MSKKIVAFDIFGTCFGFENIVQAIEEEFGESLKAAGTTPAHVFMSWFYATQRDFSYLSICDEYTPIAKVFAATLPRALAIALEPAPLYPSTSRQTEFPAASLLKITAELRKLTARPGLLDAFETLWNAKFEVYAVSNGSIDSTRTLFANINSSKEHHNRKDVFINGEFDDFIVSTDEVKKAKPSPEVYAHALSRACIDPSKGDIAWFVAAHSWDLLPAKKAGFKTAYVTYEEIVSCEDIFGQHDITEDGLAKVAKKIVDESQ